MIFERIKKGLHTPFADRDLTRRFVREIQERYVKAWKELDPKAQVSSARTIEDALDRAREIGDQNDGTHVLIMGSLHLLAVLFAC